MFSQTQSHSLGRPWPRHWSSAALRHALVLALLALTLFTGPQPAHAVATASSTPGTVVAWGSNLLNASTVPGDLSDVIAIAAGGYQNLALKSDGTVVAWGNNNDGQGTIPAGLANVTAIAAGNGHNLALRGDGTVVAWGKNNNGQATVPAGLTDVTAIAAGNSHSLVLKGDGTVVAWGNNGFPAEDGRVTVPAGLDNVIAIAAGDAHSLALQDDGTVVAWGTNDSGISTVPAELTDVTAIAAGVAHSLALKADGTVVAWGSNIAGQATVPAGLTNVIAIAAGGFHSLALQADGTVVAWGNNNFGQRTIPTGLSNVSAIAAGDYHSVALIGAATAPEIDVTGNGVSIVSGDNSPDTADHTNFGSANVDGGTVVRTFTISNTGDADLTLDGSPLVAISGDQAAEFTVTALPSSPVAAGGSTTFQITFDPGAVGVRTATVTIANDDADENPYTFAVQGTGFAPNAQLNGSACDLIDAINAANSDSASGTCPAGSGADTITLLSDITLTAANNSNNFGSNGLPRITSDITIEGDGHTLSRAVGAPLFRFFSVDSGGTLTLNSLTLHNGDALDANSNNAGAIVNNGTVTVNDSTFSNNNGFYGGAIVNQFTGTITVNNSTFSGNTASRDGGAIYNLKTVTVNGSTFSGNSAGNGGAVYNYAGSTLTLVRSLLSGNSASDGAELYNDPQRSGPAGPIPGGIINSNNGNLFGHSGNAGTSGFTPTASDIVPTVGLSAILASLADNGGPSTGSGTAPLTHALVAGSPAIDAAGDSGLDTDQRGVTRPQGCADDLGAFELEGVICPPEIDVTGNGVSIVSGDTTPDPADHTDFGSADVDGGTVVRTFTIENSGDSDLTLDGSPLVAISGDHAAEFTVTALPSSPVAAGGSTTFQITFDPGASGARTATVTIANDDGDENPYTFAVQGTGIVPNAQLNGVECDLIDAINAANSDTATGTCPAGSSVVTDTITLLSDVILSSSYDSNNGLPPITSAIAVDGAGYTISRTVDAPEFRFFEVDSTGDLTLDALTLQNGGGSNFFQYGGAIYTKGRLTVNNSVFRGNSVARYGGVLYSEYNISTVVNNSTFSGNTTDYGGVLYIYDATLTVNNSTFRDNHAKHGGALYNDSDSATAINNSTFRDNSAEEGGAIYNYYATLTITGSTFSGNSADYYGGALYSQYGNPIALNNSTFSGNSAEDYGGAIYSEYDDPIALNNSTFSGNSADYGGVIYIYDTSLTLNRTLLAGNSADYAAEIYNDGATVNADSFNLFGDSSKTNAQAFYDFTPGATDITATSDGTTPTALADILNPTLADNGGPTLTHALVDGSPAIDAAGDSGLDTDQRGVARPQGCADDLGAFELDGVTCPSPEIDVMGNGVNIAGGDDTPDPADHTDFGSVAIDGGTVVRTFTISNTGDAELTLDGSPLVAISGDQAAEFTVTAQPNSPVAAGGSTTFQITFDPGAVGARTATVTIANDDGDENPYTFAVQGTGIVPNAQLNGVVCDLIDAINAANSDTATGTCPAGSSVITDTITLLSDVILATNYDSDNGLPPISSAIAIEGADYTISRTVDAPEFRFFEVESSGVLSLNAVTLQNGGGASFYAGGGALYIDGGTLILNGSTLISNQSGDYGGAIYNDAGTVTVTGSDISGNNTKYDGAAAYNIGGTLTVADSTFAENSAPSRGGAIYNDSSSVLMLTSTLLLSNTSQSSGGAIYNSGSDLTVTDSTIAGNRATATGGAIYSASSSVLTVRDSTFTDNSTESGGGAIYNDSSELTVSDSTFTDNSASSTGGAIKNVNHGQATLTGSTLQSNSTESGGGAISNDTSSELTVSDSTFTDNSAPYNGGAIHNVYNSRLTLTNSALLGNSTTSSGGAIYTDSSDLTVRDSTFTNNSSSSSGGAIKSTNSSTATVLNSSFIGNVSQNSGGGAIDNDSTLTVRNSTFSGNQAKYSGGALSNGYNRTLQLTHSTLIGNNAQSAPGGAIANSGTLTMAHTLVSGNTSNIAYGDEIYNSGTLNANAFNLIGDSSKALARALLDFTPGVNDITATSDGTVPTALAAILDTTPADHGGGTLTHALVSGSPAIDAAGDSGLDTDQRGVARPQGCADDIGAFELEDVGCPEIDVQGNGVSIVSGDDTPNPADHTDFGSTDVDGGTVVRTFTISNTGDAELTLSGSPLVALSGDSAFSVTSGPVGSSIAAGSSSQFQITFAPSAVGVVSATVSIAGNDSDEAVYTFVIAGTGHNSAPTATDDSYSTDEEVPLHVAAPGVLENDSDRNDDALTAVLMDEPTPGLFLLRADGSFIYTPTLNFNGVVTFTYMANDGLVDSNTATVTITVDALNDAPVAMNDNYRVEAGMVLNVGLSTGVLQNDSDIEQNALTAVLVAGPSHGTLSLNPNGTFRYMPAGGFSGTDSFTYRANDGAANSTVATVTIEVLAPVSLMLPVNVASSAGGTVTLPVTFDNHGNAVSSLVFSIDYAESCLTIDPTDANGDSVPDAISFTLPAGVTRSAQLDSSDTDGEVDFFIAGTLGTIPTGTLANVTFLVSNSAACAGTTVAVRFADDPAPTFGDPTGGQVPGVVQDGSVAINDDPTAALGNCNTDGQVDAADITALVLEIFDGDGNNRTDAPDGTYAGASVCDANNDTIINAADISCMVLLIFHGPGACGSGVTEAGVAVPAQLRVPQQLDATAGRALQVPVRLQPGAHQVTAATFALTFDPTRFAFDPTDNDGDTIPDGVSVPMRIGYDLHVYHDAAAGRVMVAYFANTTDAVPFVDGTLATVTLTAHADQTGDTVLRLIDNSLGNAAGQTVAVTPADGTVRFVHEAAQNVLYLPMVMNQ